MLAALLAGALFAGGCATDDGPASETAPDARESVEGGRPVTEAQSADRAEAVDAGQAETAVRTRFAHGEDVVIDEASVTDQITLYDYDAGGTMVELLALRASDGSVRVTLNTCQSCGGSPSAFFEQDGDELVCQNCGNTFPVDTVGLAKKGGCNPVPITADEYSREDGTITVPASLLDGYADLFANWKAGL